MKKYEHNYGKNPEGVLSTTSGYATETTNFGEAAFGILNKSTRDKSNFTTPEVVSSSTATLFSVGNGSDGIRKNIIELKADGTVLITGVGEYDGTNPDDATGIADKMQGIEGIVDGLEESIDSINIVKDETNDLIYTLMVDGEERGSINIPKDQFLKSVTYNEDSNELIFTFVTSESDNKEVRVNMTDLVDTYTAGDGLNLEGGQFSIKVDADTQSYIEVTANGVKIVGINEAFNNCVTLDGDQTITGNKTFNTDVIATGFAVPEGTSNEVLTADGDSNTLKTINGQTLLGNGDVDMSEFATQGDVTELQTAVGSNTYEGSNYLTKETNLTDAVIQLDEEIKATNDNLALEHANAEATYAKKTDLSGYLSLTGGVMRNNITFRNNYNGIDINNGMDSTHYRAEGLYRNELSKSENHYLITPIHDGSDAYYNYVHLSQGQGFLDIYGNSNALFIKVGSVQSYVNISCDGIKNAFNDPNRMFTTDGGTISIQNIISQVTVPTKVSDLTNDSGFQTETQIDAKISTKADKTIATTSADGLMSAADKTKLDSIDTQNLATKSEVNAKVGGTGVSSIQVVATLPDVQEEGVLYIVTGEGA